MRAPRASLARVRSLLLAGALPASLLVSAPLAAQDLGRLFFSVEERAALDEARRDMEVRGVPRPTPTTAGPAEPQLTELTYGGSVVRGSGETTTWINGQPVLSGDATREGIRVAPTGRPGGEVRVTLPSGVGSIELRAGQRIEVISGRVIDAYEIGQREQRADAESDIELEEPRGPGAAPRTSAGDEAAVPAPGRAPAATTTGEGS